MQWQCINQKWDGITWQKMKSNDNAWSGIKMALHEIKFKGIMIKDEVELRLHYCAWSEIKCQDVK